MAPTVDGMTEADITISGVALTFAESMTVRVALETFAHVLLNQGLGKDKEGSVIAENYLRSIDSIRQLIFRTAR
jgi:hypothetical protein